MSGEILSDELSRYLDRLAGDRPGVLLEMEEEARRSGFPIVGPAVGRLLEVLTRASGATRVFEMGSGFGYSTVWFARAVGPHGQVVHTDGSEKNSQRAHASLEALGLADRVRFEVGDAREIVARETGTWDVFFCDIDKEQYPGVPELIRPRLREGGLLVFDNALWFGRVLDDDVNDDATMGVRRVTRELSDESLWSTSIVPIRDGVSVSVAV